MDILVSVVNSLTEISAILLGHDYKVQFYRFFKCPFICLSFSVVFYRITSQFWRH